MKQIVKRKREINKSLIYMSPCLMEYVNISHKNLVDAYLFYNDEYEPPKIIIKIKWTKGMAAYEQQLMNCQLFLQDLDCKDKKHLVYMFKIPEEFLKDYYTFLNGKYSQLSNKLKRNIKKFWGINSNSRLYKVLEKSEELRQQIEEELVCTIPASAELSSKPNFKEETYNDEQYSNPE